MIHFCLKKSISTILLFALCNIVSAQQYFTDVDDMVEAIHNSSDGGTFIVLDGIYNDFEVSLEIEATAEHPIIIKSETIGGVTLTGESQFVFKKSAYITLEGFVFDGEDKSTIIKFEGSNNIRISRNVFQLATDADSTAKWIYIGGYWDDKSYPFNFPSHHNRIDHNIFQNKSRPGHYITVDGNEDEDSEKYYQSQYDRIDHNYFKNNSPRAVNEQESIRVGWSEMSESSGYTIVEHNDSIVKVNADTSATLDINIIFEIVPEGWGIFGCMNPNYANYNPEAVCPAPCNQGGCMDPIACNYNEFATYDDGSCYFVSGCMDASALNYDPTACIDDGSCCFVSGCMDVTADNYDPTACIDDGSCIYNALVYVPDDNFEQALINLGYDDVMDDYVLIPNIDGVTLLDLDSLGIADLTGIENFSALTSLSCRNNQLTSLDVSQNTALTYLHCGFNQITSLDVSNNTSLTQFLCEYNQLTSLDVSQNTALIVLTCYVNQLTSLDVSNNTSLIYLYCQNNQLTSLDVSQNTALSGLICSYNQLTSLDISNNMQLNLFRCNVNSNLNCIEVSDVSWANSIPDLMIDPQQYFSLSCP